MSETVTINQLKSHLWESANLLRGKIDSSDFKHYIFGLLFYKRLSDTFDEEKETILPVMNEEEKLNLKEVIKNQHFTMLT